MQRFRVRMPFELDLCPPHASTYVLRRESNGAVEGGGYVGKAPKLAVALRDLLEDERITGVYIERSLQIPCGFFPLSQPPIDVAGEQKRIGIVRQHSLGGHEFFSSDLILEVTPVKMPRPSQMRLAGTRPEPFYGLDRRLGQSKAGWCMVNAIKINLVVRYGQLVICENICRIYGHRLYEEMS